MPAARHLSPPLLLAIMAAAMPHVAAADAARQELVAPLSTSSPLQSLADAAIRINIGDASLVDYARFGAPALRVTTRGNLNAIVGMADNDLPPRTVSFPTGVTAYGRVSAGSAGNVAFGLYSECHLHDVGSCTTEQDTFNWVAPPDITLPPNRALGIVRPMPISLTLGAGGTYQSALALHIMPEGSTMQTYANGIYLSPGAVTGTGLTIAATSASGPAVDVDLQNVGTGTHQWLTTVGAHLPGNVVQGVRRLDNGATYGAITQDGSVLVGVGASRRGVGPAACVSSGTLAIPEDSQSCRRTLRGATTSAAPLPLTIAAQAASPATQVPVTANGALQASVLVTARHETTGAAAAWRCDGLLRRAAAAGTTQFVGQPRCMLVGADTALSAATVTLAADRVNDDLAVMVTGIAAASIRWVALVDTVEIQ